MIFTTGLLMFICGLIFFPQGPYRPQAPLTTRKVIPALLVVIGMGCMGASILLLMWRYLP